jgi:bis(5'-nucleosidyl)-tetraphosphatase
MQPRQEVPDNEPTKERSYGIVPIRRIQSAQEELSTNNTEVLLIRQKPLRDAYPPFWSFPKGHAEPDDASPVDTAARELREETGLVVGESGILFRDTPGLTERYRNPVHLWVKEVKYWIGLGEGQDEKEIVVQEKELLEARWCSWTGAEELLTFEKGKEILREVMGLLDTGAKKNVGRL